MCCRTRQPIAHAAVVVRPATQGTANGGAATAEFAYANAHQRYELILREPLTLTEKIVGRDVSRLYWVPDPQKGEKGLLEMLAKRTADSGNYLLVHSRPDEELRKNFSDPTGAHIDLSLPCFKLSKSAIIVHQMKDHISDDAMLRGKVVREGLEKSIPHLQDDEYYLVVYRDYSAFATSEHRKEAKRDRMFGPLFVERHFAVLVGQNAGVFVPITEGEALYGWERICEQNIRAGATHPLYFLNTDQFRALQGATAKHQYRAIREEKETADRERVHSDPAAVARDGPSMWDWRPSAIRKRVDRYMERQYAALGHFVIKVVIVGGSFAILFVSVRQSIPGTIFSSLFGRRDAGNSSDYYSPRRSRVTQEASGGFFRFSLRDMFDYVLAPRQ